MRNVTIGRQVRREIERLDPLRDDRAVARLSLEVLHGNAMLVNALFTVSFIRQVAVPSIAKILHRRGRGDIVVRTAKRNDDTMVFFGKFLELGYDTSEGLAWIERLNEIHGHFPIRNEDSLYTLATLVLEPQRIAALVGSRPFSGTELQAQWHFWRGVAAAQRITDIPGSRDELARWTADFEAAEYARTDDGLAVTRRLVDDFADRWFPGPLRPLAPEVLSTFCDDRLRAVQNLPEPRPALAYVARSAVRTYFAATALRPVRRDRSFVETFGTARYGARDRDAVGYRRPAPARRP